MPQFTLAHYIALRTLIVNASRACDPFIQASEIGEAKDALAAIRKFFPAFEQFERDQAAKGDRL